MPKRSRKRGSKLPLFLFLVLIIVALGFIAYRYGPPKVRETADRLTHQAKEHFEPAPAQPPPLQTPQEGPAPSQSYTYGAYVNSFAFAGLPQPTTYPNHITILENSAFVVGYDQTRRNPAWVAFRIQGKTISGQFPRPQRFSTDTRTTVRVTHDDYTRSGFDRGHMAPNHTIASRFGAQAQTETFLMTNVVPQRPELNQGPWRLLEETISIVTAPAAGEVWIVTGPLYAEPATYLPSGVKIPSAFFKVIADDTPSGPKFQAFILPQSAARSADFRAFVTSVAEVERESGLDFHQRLTDDIERPLEAQVAPYWLSNP